MAVTRESTLDLSRDPSDPQPTFCLLLTSPLRFLLLREISQQGPSLSLLVSLSPLSRLTHAQIRARTRTFDDVKS